jgi:hypothetical protein
MPDLFRQLGSADPNSDIVRGFARYKQENMVPTLLAAYTKLVTDDTPSMSGSKHLTKGAAVMALYPTFADYLANLPGPIGSEAKAGFDTKPPAGAPVLKTPGKP